jgi:hypothetical protein
MAWPIFALLAITGQGATFTVNHDTKEVFISPDMCFVESTWDIAPMLVTLAKLEATTADFELKAAVLKDTAHTLKMTPITVMTLKSLPLMSSTRHLVRPIAMPSSPLHLMQPWILLRPLSDLFVKCPLMVGT